MNTIITRIANGFVARANCAASGNVEWLEKWNNELAWIAANVLPSGSGVDSGSDFDYA